MWRDLAELSMDFTYAAKTYGRIIISEVAIPAQLRTIKPTAIGGVAGGEKYVIESILFKFAIDHEKIFNGDELATYKNAGQDLLGLNIYSDLTLLLHNKESKDVPDFSFPLYCLVDYRGFRLIAVALVPIHKDTLVYGSADGGVHVVNTDPKAQQIMQTTAKCLNLSEHLVVSRDGGHLQVTKLAMCADMEMHKGSDGRYYLVDFARAMPPQDRKVQKEVKMGHLLLKLRPEWVKLQDKPLNPDVFSRFINPPKVIEGEQLKEEEKILREELSISREEDEANVVEATRKLLEEQIPLVARKLPKIMVKLKDDEKEDFLNYWFGVWVHFYGVNFRFLGKIRNCIPEDGNHDQVILRYYLLVEMIARVLKHNINNLLRKEMRRLKITGEQPYIRSVIKKCNKIFGTGEESNQFWNEIPKMLETNFPDSGKGLPKDLKRDLEDFKIPFRRDNSSNKEHPNGICLLFHVLSERCRFSWRGSVKDEFVNIPSLYSVQNPFSTTDLAALDEKVKRTQLIGHSQGVILRMQGISSKSRRGKYAEILLNQALVKFRQSLQAVPRNQRTLRNVGDVFHHLDKKGLAELFYKKAINAMPGDAISLYKYAYFMDTALDDHEAAEKYYKKSNECGMNSGNVLAYAKFLVEKRKRNDDAAKLLKEAIEKFPKNSMVYHHFAQFHHKVQSNFDLAEDYYKKALTLDSVSPKPNLLKDYADFLKDVRKNFSASEDILKKYDEIVSQSHNMLGAFRMVGFKGSNE